MKKTSLFFVYLVLTFIGFINEANAQITQSEAYELVKNNLGTNRLDTLEIFASKQIMPAFSSIDIAIETITSPDYSSWMFFIDEKPTENWSHACRYIFVGSNGELETIESTFYPIKPSLFDMDRIKKSVIFYDSSCLINPTNDKTILNARFFDDNKYAVIISGGANPRSNHVRYWNDCSYIYSTLVNIYRYNPANIFVLMSDGTNPGQDRCIDSNNDILDSSPLDLDGNGTADIQYSATSSNIQNVFNQLASTLTIHDQLFIYTMDHGGKNSSTGEVFLSLWDNQLVYASTFASWVNRINAKNINIVMGQCNSGGFIDYFKSNSKVCISTACQADQVSYAMSDKKYDEYVYFWTEAVSKKTVSGYPVGDINQDAYTTALEAYNYAKKNDTKPESPMIYSTNLLSEFLALNGMKSWSVTGIIRVWSENAYSFSDMPIINRPISLSKPVEITIDFPTGTDYTWSYSGNPIGFSSSSRTASFYAGSSSTSPIEIIASAAGVNLTQTFRFYITNTYSVVPTENASTLNVNLENESMNYTMNNTTDTYSIYNINGLKYNSGILNRNNTIDISSLSKGIYIITITNAGKIIQTEQFNVKH